MALHWGSFVPAASSPGGDVSILEDVGGQGCCQTPHSARGHPRQGILWPPRQCAEGGEPRATSVRRKPHRPEELVYGTMSRAGNMAGIPWGPA